MTYNKAEIDAIAKALESPSLYEQLVAAGCEIDNHESDLYVKATPEALAIIKTFEFRNVTRFRNQIDGEIWLDCPFAYDPFWQKVV